MTDNRRPIRVSRRDLLRNSAYGTAGVLLFGLGACASPDSSGSTTTTGAAATTTAATTATTAAPAGAIKIGFVSPRTGPAASFGEPDGFVLAQARQALANGLTIGGQTYSVEIIDKDGQADPPVSAQVAQELINEDGVDLILATSTPETTNPVADAAEAAGIPCISTVCPWEAWYFGRGAVPGEPSPFKYSFHFSFGVQQFFEAYSASWPQVETNMKVGVMWPNDADGNAIRGNLGPLLEGAGYTIVDPGAYENFTADYSAQISQFNTEECEIFNTFPLPPDFATFWRQAAQQGFRPKIAQIAKSALFPSEVEALGDIGINLATAAYWSPAYPYTSPLTGLDSRALADAYQAESGKQWTMQLGASMSLVDVGIAALQAVSDPKDRDALAAAINTLSVETSVGNLDFSSGPVPGVVATPIIGGQWVQSEDWPVDIVLVENTSDPNVPIEATLQAYA